MDSSRRAVESYWRSRMIDGVTSDEDKVAPVYKLEEICELLRASHVSIVKEVSEFILKRLDHKSPIVKQKALRLIKYSAGKSGVEFRREMQRHSAAVRQLFHYKGQQDPLKGDALNKAVRDTAHDAISAIFASDDNKPTPAEDVNKRIQGFGNTNLEMPSEDKKSFLSEVVGLGSASIMQGLSSITSAHSFKKNDTGSYKSPNLRRSLTNEMDQPNRYGREDRSLETRGFSEVSTSTVNGSWGQDIRPNVGETTNGEVGSGQTVGKSREERLLETIVTSGGVRLQPTRDALHVFLTEALKVDAMALSYAVELKLQSHLWQVRMKAVCVLEAILKQKDDEHFSVIASYFSENQNAVIKCSETPQVSLREKANKVLCLLNGGQTASRSEKPSTAKVDITATVEMPDLIDTGDPGDGVKGDSNQKQIDLSGLTSSTASTVDYLLGDNFLNSTSKTEADPFADVSFHTTEDKEQVVDDLFSGLAVDSSKQVDGMPTTSSTNTCRPEVVDVFGTMQSSWMSETKDKQDVNDLMAGLTLTASSASQKQHESGTFGGAVSEPNFVQLGDQSALPNPALFGSQTGTVNSSNPNSMFPLGATPYNIPPNFMFNPAFASQPLNYNALGSLLAQQHLLATMSNFQSLGNQSAQVHTGFGFPTSSSVEGPHVSPLPDIFNIANNPAHNLNATTGSVKKEDTKAFDFISDHLSAARDAKRLV